MNILLDPLPDSVNVDGINYPVLTDYRDWILFEMLLLDKDTGSDLIYHMLDWYADSNKIPPIDKATKPLLDFYTCGKKLQKEKSETQSKTKLKNSTPRAYDFDTDSGLIYAAYREAYHINLQVENMHWFEFRALFDALPHDTEFVRIMGYRVADTKGMSKQEKARYEKLKKLYAIDSETPKMTLEQRNAEMKQYVNERYAQMD